MSVLDRLRIRGAAQVVIFNWPKLAGGLAFAVAGHLLRRRMPWPVRLIALGAAAWTPLSVLASWWVYDLSPLRRWRFFPAPQPGRVLVAVAGFDEASPAIRARWPAAELRVVDIVTEPEVSVRRARAWAAGGHAAAGVPPVIDPARFEVGDGWDVIVLAQSLHEIRDPTDRAVLLQRVRAALAEEGDIVVVDHLRDAAGIVAFGPGAWHFGTGRGYGEAFAEAGLTVRARGRVGVLVHWWRLGR